jgi:hypothetical protein
MNVLYKDDSILVTDENLTINNYYFPTGQRRVIPWSQIKSVLTKRLTFLNGKYRVWGMGVKPYWFNSDWRADKDWMLIIDTGHFFKAVITPDDFEAAKKAIEMNLPLLTDK